MARLREDASGLRDAEHLTQSGGTRLWCMDIGVAAF